MTLDLDATSSCPACRENQRPRSSAAKKLSRAQMVVKEQEAMLVLLNSSQSEQVQGCLADNRVYVQESYLAGAGLGLFAGVAYTKGENITTYDGPMMYREQLSEESDKSYVLRIPNSGGVVIDGKPMADAIRANPRNPEQDQGKRQVFRPIAGSEWWYRGVGSMANDPCGKTGLLNAKISFCKHIGINRHLSDLAPMRAVLVATRDIAEGEEIFFRYGSEQPFKHIVKGAQEMEQARRREAILRDSYRRTWVEY